MELDLDEYPGCALGKGRRQEKRKFLMPWSLGDVLGRSNKVREVLGGRLDENVGPNLALVVSVEMKQEIPSSGGINKKEF